MRLLYLKEPEGDGDSLIVRQLAKLAADRKVTTVRSAAAALNVLHKAAPDRPFDVLVTSPALDDAVLTGIVCNILKGGTRVTLVPAVKDPAQSVRAFRAGADAVLLLENGSLVNAGETFSLLARRFHRPTSAATAAATPTERPSNVRALGDLLKFRNYLANTRPREPITVEIVQRVDADLVDAVERLIPQLSSSAHMPGLLELEQIIRDPGTILIVAREGRTIVGMLTLHTLRAVTGIHAWIQDLIVDVQARGRGASELLTKEAIRVSAARGAVTAELTSRPSHIGAGRLYQRLGFERRETHLYRQRLSS